MAQGEAAPGGAWWDRVPDDYHRLAVGTDIDRRHPISTRLTAGLDIATATGLGAVVGGVLAGAMILSRRGLARELDRLGPFVDLAVAGGAAEAFPAPPAVPILEAPSPLPGVGAHLLAFDSPHVALDGTVMNDRAYAQYWTSDAGPRRTLMFLHGFMADPYWFNARLFDLRRLYREGWDIVLVTLPFHGRRRALLHPFSGYGLFAGGLAGLNEGLRQAVTDLRVLVGYLLGRGAPSVGMAGYSLGGYLTALMAGVEPRLAHVTAICPVVSVVDIAMDWLPTRLLLRRLIAASGTDLATLRAATAVHAPLTYAPLVPPARRLIMSAAGDRMTTPRQVRLLQDHWSGSETRWFPGNHVLHPPGKSHLAPLRRFLDDCTR